MPGTMELAVAAGLSEHRAAHLKPTHCAVTLTGSSYGVLALSQDSPPLSYASRLAQDLTPVSMPTQAWVPVLSKCPKALNALTHLNAQELPLPLPVQPRHHLLRSSTSGDN